MDESLDQDIRLSYASEKANSENFSVFSNHGQDPEASNLSESQSVISEYNVGDNSSSGKNVSRRGTRGKRRNADQEKSSTTSKRGKR